MKRQVAASIEQRGEVLAWARGVCGRAACARALAGLGPPGDDLIDHLATAVGEAFNNAVLHAYRGRAPGVVELVADVSARRVEVSVVDHGTPFDPTRVPPPNLEDLPESGMGLYLMRRLVDELRYEAGPPNVIVLTKLM